MLREYFGKSPAEVEDTFGRPRTATQDDESVTYFYSTVDGELVFSFKLNEDNEDVYAITYAGETVSPPDTSTSNSEKSATPASSATAILIDMDGVRHELPQSEAEFLAEVVSTQPDVDTTDHITLDPPYRVILNGDDLALEPDELILMHRGGAKSWNSSGVRARILAAVGIK
jgi:hypothetical protein